MKYQVPYHCISSDETFVIAVMGVDSRRGRAPPWIFIHDSDKVERGLKVLFLILFFPLPPPEMFLPTPVIVIIKNNYKFKNYFDSEWINFFVIVKAFRYLDSQLTKPTVARLL